MAGRQLGSLSATGEPEQSYSGSASSANPVADCERASNMQWAEIGMPLKYTFARPILGWLLCLGGGDFLGSERYCEKFCDSTWERCLKDDGFLHRAGERR
jgi:hypothetical protein